MPSKQASCKIITHYELQFEGIRYYSPRISPGIQGFKLLLFRTKYRLLVRYGSSICILCRAHVLLSEGQMYLQARYRIYSILTHSVSLTGIA